MVLKEQLGAQARKPSGTHCGKGANDFMAAPSCCDDSTFVKTGCLHPVGAPLQPELDVRSWAT